MRIPFRQKHELVICKKCGTGFDRTVFSGRTLCDRCEQNRKYEMFKRKKAEDAQ